MIAGLPTVDIANSILSSSCARDVLSLIIPLIKIKNYKSQIPFPVVIFDVVEKVVELKNTVPTHELSETEILIFDQLINLEGFQLPTVSAIFHFCHPSSYPIVDRNIQASCGLLATEFSEELNRISLPILPAANTSIENKLGKYRNFISFLTEVKNLHNNQHQTEYSFRSLDQELMVYGVPNMKVKAENHANN